MLFNEVSVLVAGYLFMISTSVECPTVRLQKCHNEKESDLGVLE